MRYLFIHFSPDVLGGIETLIGRMSGYLISNNHEVNVITTSARKWSSVFPKGVRYIELRREFRNLFYPGLANRIWKKYRLEKPDIIKTFDLPTSWCGSLLACTGQRPIRLVSGIYNPYVFDTNHGDQVLMNGWYLYLQNYLRNIAPSSRLVCDPGMLSELKNIYGSNQNARLWPIPVDANRFQNLTRHPEPGHIVSIGRLAPMKEYNFYMVDVINKLRQRGHNVRWSVFGSGQYEQQMRAYIQERKMQQWISLFGDVPYANLGKALQTAQIFVGMGTSLLEASFCRVPNVVALAYDRSGMTYGSIYDLPFGSIGQKLDYEPTIHVADAVQRILQMSMEEYAKETDRVYQSVQHYSLNQVMANFEKIVEQSLPPKRNSLLYFGNFLYAGARLAGLNLDRFMLPARQFQAGI